MRGFGMLKDTDKLKELTESIQEAELIEIKTTPEQDARLENVTIPIMETGKYTQSQPLIEAEVSKKPDDTLQITVGDNKILLIGEVKEHIARHNQPGEGSTFSKNIKIEDVINVVSNMPEDFFNGKNPVYSTTMPDAGYNLVQQSSDIERQFPDAKKIGVMKQSGNDKIQTIGYVVDADIETFKTNDFTVIVVPTNTDYLPDSVKNDSEIMQDLENGKSFTVATAFPGDPNVPRADEWGTSGHAIIVPNNGEDADKSNWVELEDNSINESGDVVKNKPEDGSSGNKKEDEDTKEPLFEKKLGMGSLGMGKKGGLNVSPELNKGLGGGMALEENFGSNVVDESPQKEAKNRTKDSMVVRKAKEMFDEMYGSSFGKQTKFDFDSTKECGTKISNEPINRIPRGW